MTTRTDVPQKSARIVVPMDKFMESPGPFDDLWPHDIIGSCSLMIRDEDFWSPSKVLYLEGDRAMVEPMIHKIMTAIGGVT